MHHHRHWRRHHGECSHRRGMGLRGKLFVWFALAILATAATVALVFRFSTGERWREDVARVESFVAGRFAVVWDDPVERERLVRSAERDLRVHLTLRDAEGRDLYVSEAECAGHPHELEVPGKGTVLAYLPGPPPGHATKLALAILAAAFVLMLLSGALARRLSRPIRRVARVAMAIGEGDLSARVTGVRRRQEVGVLADAIDDMAERIETQIREQKELMAGVSHELRTPLGHVRLLLELAREGDPTAVDELEREVEEMDRLVGELLARSRLDFESLDHRPLDPVDLARRALERQGLDEAKLDVRSVSDTLLIGDATLLARALANLVSNAERHGGGLTRLQVEVSASEVAFVVEDAGPGFDDDAFDPFVRSESAGRHPSLGLGLALTRRIARAHGGDATVARNAEGGARVRLTVGRGADPKSETD